MSEDTESTRLFEVMQIGNDIAKSTGDNKWDKVSENMSVRVVGFPPELKNGVTTPDKLTGIPTISEKDKFNDWVNTEVADSLKNGEGFAMMVCDMDQLKKLNESFSRDHGDAQVIWATAKLTRSLDENFDDMGKGSRKLMFRSGEKGDEVIIIMSHIDMSDPDFRKNFADRTVKFKDEVSKKVEVSGTDKVAVANGGKYNLGLSIGDATVFDNTVLATVNREVASGLKTHHERLQVNNEWVEKPNIVAKHLYNIADRRASSMKLKKDITRISETLLSEKASIGEFIGEISPEYGDSRINNITLATLARFSAAKVVEKLEIELGFETKEVGKLKDIISKTKHAIRNLRRHIEKMFIVGGKETNQVKVETKVPLDKDWVVDKVVKSIGSDWADIHPGFKFSDGNDNLGATAGDDKTGLPYYSPEARAAAISMVGEAIAADKSVMVATIDADLLKNANNVSYDLGDSFIVRNSAVVTSRLKEYLGLGPNTKLYVMSRDTAGDEIVVIAVSDKSDKISEIAKTVNGLNSWSEKIGLDDQGSFTFSTSAWAVTDKDFPELVEETKNWMFDGDKAKLKPYIFFNALLKQADDNVKLLKTAKQIEALTINNFVDASNLPASIDFVTKAMAGGRMSKDSLNVVLSIISIQAAFEFSKISGSDYKSARKVFDELFGADKFEGKPEQIKIAYKGLREKFTNLLNNRYSPDDQNLLFEKYK